MLLNIKNNYPSLSQMDKAAVVADGVDLSKIERGTLLKLNADSKWEIAGAADAGNATTPGANVWISLKNGDDLTSAMAGGTPTMGDVTPKISAISIVPTVEVETDMFDGDLAVDDLVSVGADGKFVAHENGETVIGRVTAAPYTRNCNACVAVSGFRTGVPAVTVVKVLTMYNPSVATA